MSNKTTITWETLQGILKNLGFLPLREEIENITLIKPRQLLIHTRMPLPKPNEAKEE